MKKTIAAVLGIAMLTTTALAANPGIGSGNYIAPGEEIDITMDDFKSGSTGYLSTDNFAISTRKITKGANLVKEIKIDNDDEVVRIVLNNDMTLGEPKSPNLVIEQLSIKSKRENGDVARNEVLTIEDIRESIGHATTEIDIAGSSVNLVDGMNKIIDTGSTGYGTVSYNVGDLMLDARAYEGDKIFIKGTQDADSNVLKKYPDADLRFVGVDTQGLSGNYTAYLSAEEDDYVYKVSNGKVVSSGLKWSDDDYAWTGRMGGSTTYVISDIRLSTASVDDGTTEDGTVEDENTNTTNPETGANDVVGVAAALAAVSLLAVGALSLKKNK